MDCADKNEKANRRATPNIASMASRKLYWFHCGWYYLPLTEADIAKYSTCKPTDLALSFAAGRTI